MIPEKKLKNPPTLREFRHSKYLTVDDVAHRAGLTAGGVYQLERGEFGVPRFHTIRGLADALGITPEEVDAILKETFRVESIKTKDLMAYKNNMKRGKQKFP